MTEKELRQRLEQMTNDVPSSTLQAFAAAALSGKENGIMKKRFTISTAFVTAVIILLTITTAIATTLHLRIQMNTGEIKDNLRLVRNGAEIRFDPLTDEYVTFKSYRPLWVPEGYELTYVSEVKYGTQLLSYTAAEKNDALTLYVCRSNAGIHRNGMGINITEVLGEEKTNVGSADAVLYTTPNGGCCLAWANQEDGFGFIMTSDSSVDVLRIAESVAPDPELVSTKHDSELALQLIGDYRITALPTGYTEAERGGSYRESDLKEAQVYIWYLNEETNDVIEFEYNNAGFCEADDLASYYDNAVPVTVKGMNGMILEDKIIWHDKNSRLMFAVTAKDMSASDLVCLAESAALRKKTTY